MTQYLNKINDDLNKEKDNIIEIHEKLKQKENIFSEFNEKKFNEFYDYEKKIRIKEKNDEYELKFPEQKLEIEDDTPIISDIERSIDNSYTNIQRRQVNYEQFLNTLKLLPVITTSQKVRDDFLIEFNKYINLDFKIYKDDFDDEYCLKKNLINIKFKIDQPQIVKQYINEKKEFNLNLNEFFVESLEVIEWYDIEKLIINPDLNKILKLPLNSTIIGNTTTNISNFISYESINCDYIKSIIIKYYDFLVTNYDKLDINFDNTQLDKRLQPEFTKLQLQYDKLYKDNKAILDVNFKLKEKIESKISVFNSFDLKEKIINYEKHNSDYKKYNNFINKIKLENEILIKINTVIISEFKKQIKSLKVGFEKINNSLLEIEKEINEVEKYNQIINLIEKYNRKLISKTKESTSGLDYNSYQVDITTLFRDDSVSLKLISKLNKQQIKQNGGSGFDQYFSKIVDLTVKQTNNLEFKIKFNKLLFYCHALFIINYKYKPRNIITKINYIAVNKYLYATNYILELFKQYSNFLKPQLKNIKEYFLKYHYINIKLLNNFLTKLKNNWIYVPLINKCNKDILSFNQKDKIYFKLLNIEYNISMKKAIFILIALKPILDDILKILDIY